MGNNQSNHFPHIPEKVTWSLNTIINGKSQTLLSDFFFQGRGGCTQARLRVQTLSRGKEITVVCTQPVSLLRKESKLLYSDKTFLPAKKKVVS